MGASPIKCLSTRREAAKNRREARQRRGWSLQELASRIRISPPDAPPVNVSADTLADWEDAAYWPLPEVSERWREALRRGRRTQPRRAAS